MAFDSPPPNISMVMTTRSPCDAAASISGTQRALDAAHLKVSECERRASAQRTTHEAESARCAAERDVAVARAASGAEAEAGARAQLAAVLATNSQLALDMEVCVLFTVTF